ncbi:1,4-alpha-glucan branching protein GlgB [Domibacillus sp. DTU_2020_1001157_1_SI_ALB_TIR_016]|uniref:1,4-alpha-glucan branching protein GlgB n=1 Tax=Domibacillus sp. DTU_2020_1001157_1_SI_ALB_TIR_016 TaxID=3077789 RepID=UPI0028E68904|nr:1,4-alpha-glucan branching protein GlgB [Domibacillus sp. DTU_2020_1001157_1_SI_ALB_TIR_016]WNS81659.1 1,4-alpha-glucan branching protein GlgB [Domibacillus sp. DTU_2020_1001157_1_SI_ALB_TIR_016]
MSSETFYPSDFDLHLFHEGNLFKAYKLFGAHVQNEKTCFVLWAPNARKVRVIGDFNSWDGLGYEMHQVSAEGVWFLKVPRNLEGSLYKYEIVAQSGRVMHKTDPFAFMTELRPNTAGVVKTLDHYQWRDEEWLRSLESSSVYEEPLAIYEMHLGTWKRKGKGENDLYTYRELADMLIPHVKEQGFTHIEVMPITEHPFDRSWGYQSTGYFATTRRYGEPKDFMYFVDECHRAGLGVILDWVPGHFCKDAHGLHNFDGNFSYEYENSWDRENYVWGTANFDLSKTEVHSFLISNALFWMDYYHIDGFRVDAVSNIFYWPNRDGLEANPHGVAFLQKLNKAVFSFKPQALMIAEDSSDWPQVTAPVHQGGIGFNYKWNMGWMNDVLEYMETHWNERSQKHHLMTFSLMYAYSENYILPFSHDEVVHGKKSLLDKMPGDYWQKFAQLRLLLMFMMAHPGKKLLFMGTELAPFSEWKDLEEVDWHLTDYDMHHSFNRYFTELLHCYQLEPALFERDHSPEGFEWIDVHNHQQSILSFVRKDKEGNPIVIVCNFGEYGYSGYRVGVPEAGQYEEILNSDRALYGGSNQVNNGSIETVSDMFHGQPAFVEINIPPFGAVYLRRVDEKGRN